MAVTPIPEGYHTVTPHLVIRDAAKAIDWYKQALGATELRRAPGPGGKLIHAEIKIGDSAIMLVDEFPEWGSKSPQALGGCHTALHIYTEDTDALYDRAVKAGAKATMPPMDAFWGDRYGKLTDPFGHEWSIATHKEDLSPEETQKRAQEYFADAAGKE